MRIQVVNRNASVEVEIEGVQPDQYQHISEILVRGLERNEPAYHAVSQAMQAAVQLCPQANPADLWVHVVYREFRTTAGRSDQSWKRVSGQAFEHFFLSVYVPRLAAHGITLRLPRASDAVDLGLRERGIGSSKTDLIVEGVLGGQPRPFGAVHCKVSIAERLSDDAPASVALIGQNYWSAVVTMDAKMYPPPTGDAVVRGELKHTRTGDKRRYFEVAGQFSGCYSFNTRTPPSGDDPPPKARIHALTFTEEQPDVFVRDAVAAWELFRTQVSDTHRPPRRNK